MKLSWLRMKPLRQPSKIGMKKLNRLVRKRMNKCYLHKNRRTKVSARLSGPSKKLSFRLGKKSKPPSIQQRKSRMMLSLKLS